MSEYTKINDFIEKGSIISLKALREYAMDIITKENLEYVCNDVESLGGNWSSMHYDMDCKVIRVNVDGCISSVKSNYLSLQYNNTLRTLIKNFKYWRSLKCRNNIINMYLLYVINHELEHVRQMDLINRFPEDNMSKLLKITKDFITTDYDKNDGELYYFYHGKFLIEFQANAHSGFKLFNEILEKYENLLSCDELAFFSRYIAKRLLTGYVGVFDNQRRRTTPIKHLIYISRRFGAKKEQEILMLEANETLKNDVEDILLGRDVPNDILNSMDDVAKGRIKTKNPFKDIYSTKKYYV